MSITTVTPLHGLSRCPPVTEPDSQVEAHKSLIVWAYKAKTEAIDTVDISTWPLAARVQYVDFELRKACERSVT